MKLGLQKIEIKALMRRGFLKTEMRVKIIASKVRQYAEEMAEGSVFPAPVVFIDPKEEFLLVGDGFHRILAHKLNKNSSVEVDLKRGDYTDAILWNIEANRKQRGIPFGSGDKAKCILELLRNERTEGWTLTKMADVVGCSKEHAARVARASNIERTGIIVRSNGRPIKLSGVSRKIKAVEDRKKLALNMSLNNFTQAEIGEKLGVSTRQVLNYLSDTKQNLITCPTCHGKGVIEDDSKACLIDNNPGEKL